MPILVPDQLPALTTLKAERVPVMTEGEATRQDIRPLRVLILNVMPDKVRTETQLLRVLGVSPLQIEVTFIHPASHISKNTAQDHLERFYQTHADIKDQCFDAMIVTGAPIETLAFDDVTYWGELAGVFDWAERHVYSSLFLCWGAQAALYHYHGVAKHPLETKMFGVYPHRTLDPYTPLTTGFDDSFGVPVSRETEVCQSDIDKIDTLRTLVTSEESGACLVENPDKRRVFMFNHLEYDAETLKREYVRDREKNQGAAIPVNYFPDDNPDNTPHITWRAHRNLLFSNWINTVYQGTPYDLGDLLK